MPYPILAPNSSWYKGTVPRATITEINIVDSYIGTEAEVWNADVDNSGSIKCYLNGTILTIAGNGTGKIYANADSSYTFSDSTVNDLFKALTIINGLNLLDTSKVTNMKGMFTCCLSLKTLDLSSWDVSNVENMYGIFMSTGTIGYMTFESIIGIGNWNTAKVTTMQGMFQDCAYLTEIDISNWNVDNVTNLQAMFYNCLSLKKLDLSRWNVSNVENLYNTFYNCAELTEINLSNWDTSKVTKAIGLFAYCTSLSRIYVSEKWNVDNITASSGFFGNCFSLVGGAGTKYVNPNYGIQYAVIDNGDSAPGYLTYLGSGILTNPHDIWMISDAIRALKGDTTHYSIPEMVSVLREYPVLAAHNSWYQSSYDSADITAINVVLNYVITGAEDESWVADEGETGSIMCYRIGSTLTLTPVGKNKIRMNADSSRMFSEMTSLVSISGLDYLDASSVESFEGACYQNTSLTEFIAPTWRCNKVLNTNSAFYNCISLSTVNIGRGLNVVGNRMFFNCSSLRNITGVQSVKTIDELAFYATPNLVTTDMKKGHITRIGKNACRLSGIEDNLDLSHVKLSFIGDYATRLKRWGEDSLAAIKNVAYPNTSVYIEVPNSDSQLNYANIPFGHDSDGNEYSVAEYGCTSLVLYHLWNAVYAGTEKEYDNWLDWWNATLNSDGTFADNNNIATNTAIGARFSRLGWTLTGTPRVSSADQLTTILNKLSSGDPVYAVINNSSVDTHAIAIIGYDADTHKLAVLDSGLYGHENGLVYWVSFEDIFVGGAEEPDRLHLINYNRN